MANQKQPRPDPSVAAVLLLNKATGTKKVKGEDLISDPRLKREFREAKRKAKSSK